MYRKVLGVWMCVNSVCCIGSEGTSGGSEGTSDLVVILCGVSGREVG